MVLADGKAIHGRLRCRFLFAAGLPVTTAR